MAKKIKDLRVIGIPWHIGHQYELAKLFKSYDLLINPWRKWGERSRPIPDNVRFVDHYEPGKYDLAILHIDQQSIYDPEAGERVSKGRLYQEVNLLIQDIPKIVINHMTPFHDKYSSPEVVEKIKHLVGDNTMVVNSNEARLQWGWGNTIIHGMTPDEWYDLPKEPRVITAISPGGLEKAYRRIFLRTVKRYLDDMGVNHVWIGADTKGHFSNWEEYRQYIGRSLVYFNPTWQSPMPRSRTEAMLSGACIVTTPYHDADSFIKEGKNGFLTSKETITDPRVMDNPRYTADLLYNLIVEQPQTAIEVGQNGKKFAQEYFHIDRFKEQWSELLTREGIL